MTALPNAVRRVLLDLFESFAELNDDPDAPFGEYATVSQVGNRLTVTNEDETVGVVIEVSPYEQIGDRA
jgi:hypothetical protein